MSFCLKLLLLNATLFVSEAPSHRPTFPSEMCIWWVIHAQVFAPWLPAALRTCVILHRRIRAADFHRIFMQCRTFVRNHVHKGIPINNGVGRAVQMCKNSRQRIKFPQERQTYFRTLTLTLHSNEDDWEYLYIQVHSLNLLKINV